MPPRVLLALMVLVGATVTAVVLVGLSAGREPSETGSSMATATGFVGGVRPPEIPARPFVLRDEQGQTVRTGVARPRPAMLAFVYSTCEESCPLTMQQVRGALDELGAGAADAYAVSVDPANDTPARARQFLREQSVAGRIPFLLGTRDDLEPLWQAYGVQPQSEESEHAISVVLLDREGRQRVSFHGDDLTADGLAHDLRKLAADA